MDLLTTITITSLVISFFAGVISQIWKGAVEIEGKLKKRLTPAGWLSLGISLVTLLTSLGSELVRVNIKHNEQLRAQLEAQQEKTLKDQEARWRSDVNSMLRNTKVELEQNLVDTIDGFRKSQSLFNKTQKQISESRQSLLESGMRHTQEIVIASQPLTGLNLHLGFASADSALWLAMKEGQERLSPTYGVNPETRDFEHEQNVVTPFKEYNYSLLPLVSYLSHIGERFDPPNYGEDFIVLISLDEAQNAILSFGQLPAPEEPTAKDLRSAGFLDTRRGIENRRRGNSIPHAEPAHLAASPNSGLSTYTIDWSLDSVTLWNALDLKKDKVVPTARLPRVVRIVIFSDINDQLPFADNFASPTERLWTTTDEYVNFGSAVRDARLTIFVNDLLESKLVYELRRIARRAFYYEWTYENGDVEDKRLHVNCTVLVFEAT